MLSLANITPRMGPHYYLKKDDYYSQEKGPAKPEFFGKGCTMLGIKKRFNLLTFQKLINGENVNNEPLRFKRTKEFPKKGIGSFKYITKSFSKDLALACEDENLTIDLMNKFKEYESTKHLTGIKAQELNLKLAHLAHSKLALDEAIKLQNTFDKYTQMISKKSDRAGLDMTFSAPKSVSIAALVGGDKKLLKAHKEAVKFTLKYVEDHFIGSRIGPRGAQRFESTKNMTAALFHHGTSRMQDPQLHTHCVVMNTTFDSTGKWKATFNDHIFNNGMLIGTIYQKKLADLAIGLGYKAEINNDGTFNLVGYSEDQLAHFSKRSTQLKDVIESNDMSDSVKSRKVGVLMNRPKKELYSPKELWEKWQKEASDINLKHPIKTPRSSQKQTNWSFASRHISESYSVWDENKLLLETIKANMDTCTIEHLFKNYKAKSNIILVDNDGKKIGYTNSTMIKIESELIDLMREDKGNSNPITKSNDLDEIASFRNFTTEQTEAFKMALTNNESVFAWHGVAGSGKSYVLEDVAKIADTEGFNVLGLAPDGNTANLMKNDVKVKTQTIDSFLKKKISSKDKKQLWIIDESGKISTEKMLSILKKKKNYNEVKILFVGDTRQIGAVNAGSPLKLLLKKGMHHCELNDHRRQKNNKKLQTIVVNASKDNLKSIEDSVDLLDKNVLEFKTRTARFNNVIKSYLSLDKETRDNTIILTDYNKDRIDLTIALRKALKKAKILPQKDKRVSILRSKNISEEQKKYYYTYKEGEYLIPFEDIENTNIKKGNQYKITSVNKLNGNISLDNNGYKAIINPNEFSSFSLHYKDEIDITLGDKLQFIKNYENKTNREEIIISGIKGSKVFYDHNNKSFDLEKSLPHIDYSHVKTTYSSQGQTKDRVIFLADCSIAKENWYVALSRAKQQVVVVTDDKEKLKKRIKLDQAKVNAHDFDDFKFERKPSKEKPLPKLTPTQDREEFSYGVSL